MPNIGDRIRFLNSTGGGIITRIEGQIAYVDDDGFETPTLLRECVVVEAAADARKKAQAPDAKPAVTAAAPKSAPKPSAQAAPEPAPE
ncbi:MAG: DUF2027 domain-containing protein, partial [Duncaniella sp.]|nr:DUF2027 domain-containing protein [Duncaniella sp.]